MIDAEFIDSAVAAAGLICLIASIFADGHARTYFALLAIMNVGLAGMFS